MSGPKGYSYNVVSQEELARRALSEARRRLAVVSDRFEIASAVAKAWPELDSEVVRLRSLLKGPTKTAEDVDRLTSRYSETIQTLERLTSDAASAQVRRSVANTLGTLRLTIDPPTPRAQTVSRSRVTPAASAIAARIERLEKTLAQHPSVAEESAADLARIKDVVDRGGSKGELAPTLRGVEFAVAQRIRLHNVRAEMNIERQNLKTAVSDLTGPEAEVINKRIDAASSRQELAAARTDAAKVRQQLRRDEDRRYVLQAAQAALTELGYEVEVDNAVPGATQVLAVNGRFPDHALKVLFRGDDPTFYTNVVGLADSSAAQDAEVERATCSDLDQVMRAIAEHGIRTSMEFHRQPGQVPLERDRSRSTKTAARRQRRADREQAL